MPVPKYRTSKSKKNMRRSHHALAATAMSRCPNCKEVKYPHRVCESCGHYGGRQMIEPRTITDSAKQSFDTEGK